jgi:hypothetical protein
MRITGPSVSGAPPSRTVALILLSRVVDRGVNSSAPSSLIQRSSDAPD